jgi:hypothetical protein
MGIMTNVLKLVVETGLLTITGLAWPNPRNGAAIAIGVCILAAIALHFFAP